MRGGDRNVAQRSLQVAETLRAREGGDHEEELNVAEEQLREAVEELARLQAEVEVERERYGAFFRRAPLPYVVTDAHGMLRDANAAACTLFGVEERFVRGKPLSVFVCPSDVARFRTVLATAARTGFELDVDLRTRDGRIVPSTLRVAPAHLGRTLLWLVTPREPAAPDPLARALRDRDERLAREVKRREQLELEARAKDRFLAILSHDLRGPLHATLGWTDLLRRERLDAVARDRALATIERNARAQLVLVEELLDISRIVADKLQLETRPVALAPLVRRVVEARAPEAREKRITMTCRVPSEEVVVLGDEKRLAQVASNLVDNALKYSVADGAITVVLDRVRNDAVLRVEDRGVGIAPELLPHVFDGLRRRIDDTASRSGLGLGLHIVRQLVELHGGTIHAASGGTGRGATFTVTLPRAESHGANGDRDGEGAPASLHRGIAGVRVLVVDDDDDVREIVAMVLREGGADVILAGAAEEAIRACSTVAPDVIVSDIGMPGQDGLALIRELRARLPTVPTVAMTGLDAAPEIDAALEVGFDVRLTKPVAGKELIEAIRRAIDVHER